MQNVYSKFRNDLIDRCYKFSLDILALTDYWLNFLLDTNLGDKITSDKFLKENEEIGKMLAAGVLKLKKKSPY